MADVEMVSNGDEVAEWLEDQVGDFADTRAGMIKQATDDAYEKALDEVPVDTGALKESLTKRYAGNEGEIYSELEYAPHVGLGTIYMDQQDYLWGPARKALKKALKDFAKDD